MGILVMLISLCIVTAVIVASVTAVIGGIAGSELDEEDQILLHFIMLYSKSPTGHRVFSVRTQISGTFLRKPLFNLPNLQMFP